MKIIIQTRHIKYAVAITLTFFALSYIAGAFHAVSFGAAASACKVK